MNAVQPFGQTANLLHQIEDKVLFQDWQLAKFPQVAVEVLLRFGAQHVKPIVFRSWVSLVLLSPHGQWYQDGLMLDRQ